MRVCVPWLRVFRIMGSYLPHVCINMELGWLQSPELLGDTPARGRGIATRWSLTSLPTLSMLWYQELCVEVVKGAGQRLQVCTEWGVCRVGVSFTKVYKHPLYKEWPSHMTVIFYMSSWSLQNFLVNVYWLDTKFWCLQAPTGIIF